MGFEAVKVGIIGCGVISDAYVRGALRSKMAVLKAVADERPEASALYERAYEVSALAVDDLLADPEIEIVLNLTPPQVHAPMSRRIIEAGKHVYTEKPLAHTFAEGKALMALAEAKGRRVSSAPDTFLGAAHQAARQLVDAGGIGQVAGGAMSWLTRGSADFHTKRSFFIFKQGGGPHMDMGPYYVSQLINLIGPVKRVTAIASNPFPHREVLRGPLKGAKIDIEEVPTTVNGVLEFVSGANVSITVSWDVHHHMRQHFELYGGEGTLYGADPNYAGGEVMVAGRDKVRRLVDTSAHPFGTPTRVSRNGESVADYRYLGVVDLAAAIRNKRPHRASGELALHVLEVLEGLETSSREGRHITMTTTAQRPIPVPLGEGEDVLANDFATYEP